MSIKEQINKAIKEGDHRVPHEFTAGVVLGMEIAADIVQRHQCQEARTGDCTCIHDGDAAAKVIKKKLEELK